jgi:hypothetical protein
MNEQAQHAAGGVGALLILLMPLFKEYSPLVLGALVGVMHPVSRLEFPEGWRGKGLAALFMLKWVLTAVLFTGFASYMLERFLGIPANAWPELVAFIIAFLADDWYGVKSRVIDGVLSRVFPQGGQP